MSAHDELQRQLAESVGARAPGRRFAAASSLTRWWRRSIGAVPLAALLPLLFVFVMLGSTRLHSGAPATPVGLLVASAAEGPCAPCRAVGGRLHAPPSEELLTLLPASLQRRDVRIRYGRPIVRMVGTGRALPEAQMAPVG